MGINPYGVEDYGYSDYIKDYISDNDKLETYVNYSKKNLRTIDLIKDIEDNVKIERRVDIIATDLSKKIRDAIL